MTDPNLDLGLDYTGGINKPTANQVGYYARVDSTGLNLEYLPDYVVRALVAGAFTDTGKLTFTVRDVVTGRSRLEVWIHDGVSLNRISATSALRITTVDATVTTIATFAVLPSQTISLSARFHGRDSAGNEGLRESTYVFRRVVSANATQWGTTVDIFPYLKDDAAWGTPGLVLSTTNGLIQVTGKAATSITWDVELVWREL